MPLPTNPETPWPPLWFRGQLQAMKEQDAWYSGDSDRLAAFYGASAMTNPGQRRGIWARGFRWGSQTNPQVQAPTRLHVPVASDIARTSADLLFSEPPEIKTEPAAQDRLDELLDAMSLDARLLEAAETAAAIGGCYWRVTFDTDAVPDRPILDFVDQDNAVPEWRWHVLMAVTFTRRLPDPGGDEQVVWRHLERYERGYVFHGLYRGDGEKLGQLHPLVDHPDTAGIAASLTSEDYLALPVGLMAAGYIPNMLPNRRARGLMIGRADCDGLRDALDSIDETWTSWMRDLRLARARLVVPDEYLTAQGRGQGATFDYDRELYSPLKMPPPEGSNNGMTLVQFAIRVDEHERTMKALLAQTVTSAGYSLQSLGLTSDSAAAMTATEVQSRERLSMITRSKKTRYWLELRAALFAVLAVDSFQNFPNSVAPAPVDIVFGDSVSDDPKSVAETVNLLNQAVAASTETRVRIVHPDWDDERVTQEVAAILDENGQSVPDPGALAVPPAVMPPGARPEPDPASMLDAMLNGAGNGS